MCRDINSRVIKQYIVRYRRVGESDGESVLREAPSSPFTLSDNSLVTLVQYEIEVATVNSHATGSYSSPVKAVILRSKGQPHVGAYRCMGLGMWVLIGMRLTRVRVDTIRKQNLCVCTTLHHRSSYSLGMVSQSPKRLADPITPLTYLSHKSFSHMPLSDTMSPHTREKWGRIQTVYYVHCYLTFGGHLKLHSAPAGPGPISSLRVSPDIASILVAWQPPTDERGGAYVTEYEVTHRLSFASANPIRRMRLSNSTFSFRVSDLLPDVLYEVAVRALIEEYEGQNFTSVQKTLRIGEKIMGEGLHRSEVSTYVSSIIGI